jgi:hypothetical protein
MTTGQINLYNWVHALEFMKDKPMLFRYTVIIGVAYTERHLQCLVAHRICLLAKIEVWLP